MTVQVDLDRLLRDSIRTKHMLRFQYRNQEPSWNPTITASRMESSACSVIKWEDRAAARCQGGVCSMSTKCKTAKCWSGALLETEKPL